MNLRSVKNFNAKGKKVLLRVDFNVPIEKGKVDDDFRIERALMTIKFLKQRGAKIILISHLTEGRAKSLKPVAKYLSSLTKWRVDFSSQVLGRETEKKISTMKNGDILLLENLRNDKREKKNDKNFAKQLAKLGEVYVNDAFSVSHREHVSIIGLPKYLPPYVGFLFEEEFKNLQSAFKPKHPFLLILGGVKFGTKLGVLEKFNAIADKIYVGGALANNFFWAKKINIGKSAIDKKVNIKKFLRNPKIVLPVDVKKKNSTILDIGPFSIKEILSLIQKQKFILWNGPMGSFEVKGFERGTAAVARAMARSSAKTIIGGGDTISAVKKAGVSLNKFSFVSTAGGAMLEFLAKGTLPGIEALKKSK